MPDRAARALNAPAERERSARGLPPNIRMKTGSWSTALPDGHIRIGTSRGTPGFGMGKGFRMYRKLNPGPWFNRVGAAGYSSYCHGASHMAIILSQHLTRRLDEKRPRRGSFKVSRSLAAGPSGLPTGRRVPISSSSPPTGPRSPAAMIKTTCDPEADVAEISFGAKGAVYDGSQEAALVLHIDTEGRVIGVEIEAVSLRMAGTYGVPVKQDTAAE